MLANRQRTIIRQPETPFSTLFVSRRPNSHPCPTHDCQNFQIPKIRPATQKIGEEIHQQPRPAAEKNHRKAADAPRKQPKTVLSVQHGSSSTERDRNLTNDTLWLFGLVATCYSAIALLTFTMRDPSWSRSVPHLGMVKNLAGLLGAYLADIAYYLFGFSAWWCIIAAGVALYRTFRPLVDAGMPPYKKIGHRLRHDDDCQPRAGSVCL